MMSSCSYRPRCKTIQRNKDNVFSFLPTYRETSMTCLCSYPRTYKTIQRNKDNVFAFLPTDMYRETRMMSSRSYPSDKRMLLMTRVIFCRLANTSSVKYSCLQQPIPTLTSTQTFPNYGLIPIFSPVSVSVSVKLLGLVSVSGAQAILRRIKDFQYSSSHIQHQPSFWEKFLTIGFYPRTSHGVKKLHFYKIPRQFYIHVSTVLKCTCSSTTTI